MLTWHQFIENTITSSSDTSLSSTLMFPFKQIAKKYLDLLRCSWVYWYKSDLNNLKGTLKRVSAGNAQQGAREELLESGMADTLAESADQRSRLLRTTERQNQTSERLRDSHITMRETEDLGVSILHDLHQQRQSLLHSHDTLHSVDDNVGKSRKIIGAMMRRMDRNKWIIGFIIALLVLAILVILYFKFVH